MKPLFSKKEIEIILNRIKNVNIISITHSKRGICRLKNNLDLTLFKVSGYGYDKEGSLLSYLIEDQLGFECSKLVKRIFTKTGKQKYKIHGFRFDNNKSNGFYISKGVGMESINIILNCLGLSLIQFVNNQNLSMFELVPITKEDLKNLSFIKRV